VAGTPVNPSPDPARVLPTASGDGCAEFPLFPLGTVLFPDGVLPLRIFETRYLDMVRRCMAQDSPFGVCLITRGGEVGTPAEHHSIGCSARIVDFDMDAGGVLQLRTVGHERFEVLHRTLRKDGLLVGTIRTLAPDPIMAIPPALSVCVELMEAIVQDLRKKLGDAFVNVLAEPLRMQDCGWVANRLSELLPLSAAVRQELMSLTDPIDRLSQIAAMLSPEGSDPPGAGDPLND
jgi:Lon protease-like protein